MVNCRRVTTSPESVALGVPLAVWGLLYFVAMAALTVPAVSTLPVVARLSLAAATVGVVSVIYLVYLELFVVDAICLWCTVVHVIVFGLFAILVLARARET